MKLSFFTFDGHEPQVRPASLKRDWMDETYEKFAYRCLPLNIANQHGWEVLCPCDFEAKWSGKQHLDSLKINSKAPPHLLPISHFGSGVLTFHIQGLIRTEPGYNLYVTGPANGVKDAIVPLSGIIETDWSPFSFTMNWKMTRAHFKVAFKKGEPICQFFPVKRDLVEETEPVMRPLHKEPELERQFNMWRKSRKSFNQELHQQGTDASEAKWQKSYFQGFNPDGTPAQEKHRTKVTVKPFTVIED